MKIAFIGDIMLGRLISNKYKHQPYQLVSEEVVSDLKKYDKVVANLESPIISSEIVVDDHMCFSGNPEFLSQFNWVNLFSTANNHINDFGNQGIKETLEGLEKGGIKHNGIYTQQYEPYVIEEDKIVIVTLTDLMNHEIPEDSEYNLLRMDKPEVIEIINEWKQKGFFVIVFAHVGMLFTRYPNPITYNYLHQYVDAGAKLIVTSHSHCLGGIEYYKDVPIIHSLGDFLMDGASFRRRKASYLTVEIDNGAIKQLEVTPVITTDELFTDYPDEKTKQKMLKSFYKVGETIEKHRDNYERFYKRQYNKEILQHSKSTLYLLYKTKGIYGLIKTILVRMEDVKRIMKWSVTDRSKVQSDKDALDVKKVLSEKDIYGKEYD